MAQRFVENTNMSARRAAKMAQKGRMNRVLSNRTRSFGKPAGARRPQVNT